MPTYLWVNRIIFSNNCSTFKVNLPSFLGQSGMSGALHWCICGICHKHQKYLCNMLVSFFIVKTTQDVQVYQWQCWHIHKGSEGHWYQYGTYSGPPKLKEHSQHNGSLRLIQHPYSKHATLLSKSMSGDHIHHWWSVLCIAWNNILPGEMVWYYHAII